MKGYLIGAVSVLFLSVIVSLIIPSGKLNKSITFVMRLVCIAVLIQPITGIFKISDGDGEMKFFDYEYVVGVYAEHQGEQLEKLLEKEIGVAADCAVTVIYSDGQFKADGIVVTVDEINDEKIDAIYEYLSEKGYINITVYAKSS